ncbi:MAG: FkbM family methyltransferase [Cyanobacteria bacterium J06634_5]
MKSLRTVVEKLSRGKYIKRKISVNGRHIPLLVSPDAQLKYLIPGKKSFDQDLISIAETYLDVESNVWDIGENVGVFTFASASVASNGTVVSVEADIWLANLLKRTAGFNQYADKNICVIPTAISKENSVASFIVASRGRASNSLETSSGLRSQMGGVREKQFVPTLTMDTLLTSLPKPDFIKIDIEGAEYMAIQGATKIINTIRPMFYIEIGHEVFPQIFAAFKEANYAAFDPAGKPLTTEAAFNVFFVPEEKIDDYHSCRLASLDF